MICPRSFTLAVVVTMTLLLKVRSFAPIHVLCHPKIESELYATFDDKVNCSDKEILQRRLFLQMISVSTVVISCDNASAGTLPSILSQVKEARSQLEPIPDLIKEEKWDSVRAILIKPPLQDCWTKSSKVLTSYARTIGEELPDGDELTALELKEEALDHLRFLDMAAYNNVFNPIRTEGESGATKELIRSYYEDPVNEYNACIRAFDGLIELSKSQ